MKNRWQWPDRNCFSDLIQSIYLIEDKLLIQDKYVAKSSLKLFRLLFLYMYHNTANLYKIDYSVYTIGYIPGYMYTI